MSGPRHHSYGMLEGLQKEKAMPEKAYRSQTMVVPARRVASMLELGRLEGRVSGSEVGLEAGRTQTPSDSLRRAGG